MSIQLSSSAQITAHRQAHYNGSRFTSIATTPSRPVCSGPAAVFYRGQYDGAHRPRFLLGSPKQTSYIHDNGPPRRGGLRRMATRRQWCSPIRNSLLSRDRGHIHHIGGTIALASAMRLAAAKREGPRAGDQRRWTTTAHQQQSSIEAARRPHSNTSFGMNEHRILHDRWTQPTDARIRRRSGDDVGASRQ